MSLNEDSHLSSLVEVKNAHFWAAMSSWTIRHFPHLASTEVGVIPMMTKCSRTVVRDTIAVELTASAKMVTIVHGGIRKWCIGNLAMLSSVGASIHKWNTRSYCSGRRGKTLSTSWVWLILCDCAILILIVVYVVTWTDEFKNHVESEILIHNEIFWQSTVMTLFSTFINFFPILSTCFFAIKVHTRFTC